MLTAPGVGGTDVVGLPELTSDDLGAIARKQILRFEPALLETEDLEDMSERLRDGLPITVSALGTEYLLDLFLNPVFSAQMLADQPLIKPYRGTVRDHAGSSVRLTLDLERGVLDVALRFSDGTLLSLEPVHEGGPLHVWYDNDDAIVTPIAHPIPRAEESSTATDGPAPGASGPAPWGVSAPDGLLEPEAAGNATNVGSDASAGLTVYESPRLRVYYDTGTNPTAIVNRMDELWEREMLIRFEVLSTSSINTDSYDDDNCGTADDFWYDFVANRPLTGTEPNRNDKALLFTNNPSVNYRFLGCGGSNHAWVRWTGSDKQKAIVGDQELGHAFSATHDDATRIDHWHPRLVFHCHTPPQWLYEIVHYCYDGHDHDEGSNHQHWTVMHGTYEGDDSTEETFSATSQGEIEPYASSASNIPRRAQIWTGSDVSSANVKLTWWEIRHPKNSVGGSIIELTRTWSANSGTVSLAAVFVGARNGADDNRDFGGVGSQTLTTASTTNEWSHTLPSGQSGTWHFWPAYDSCGSGCWGPYKWQEITFSVS